VTLANRFLVTIMERKKHVLNNSELLTELRIEFATLAEQFKAACESNNKDHSEIKEQLTSLSKIAGEEIKQIEERLRKLEDKSLTLSVTWKTIIFLIGAAPIILAVLEHFKII